MTRRLRTYIDIDTGSLAFMFYFPPRSSAELCFKFVYLDTFAFP